MKTKPMPMISSTSSETMNTDSPLLPCKTFFGFCRQVSSFENKSAGQGLRRANAQVLFVGFKRRIRVHKLAHVRTICWHFFSFHGVFVDLWGFAEQVWR